MRRAAWILFAVTVAGQAPKQQIPFSCVPDKLDAAGLSCTAERPCPVFVELSALETLGGKIFLAGNLHTEDTTLSSLLMASEDGGRTWIEPHPRLDFAGLEHLQFADFQNGWIDGQVLQGRPHDAFFLITRDGGKSWQQRPLFEDSRPGVIQQFWFDSKNTGELVFDRLQANESGSRYELYETQVGGETWALKEVSARPLTIRKARNAAPNPDWRIRADAATKSYAVEQRQDGRWRTLAMFPIQIAVCTRTEAKLEEAPPPEEEVKPAEPTRPAAKKKR